MTFWTDLPESRVHVDGLRPVECLEQPEARRSMMGMNRLLKARVHAPSQVELEALVRTAFPDAMFAGRPVLDS